MDFISPMAIIQINDFSTLSKLQFVEQITCSRLCFNKGHLLDLAEFQ